MNLYFTKMCIYKKKVYKNYLQQLLRWPVFSEWKVLSSSGVNNLWRYGRIIIHWDYGRAGKRHDWVVDRSIDDGGGGGGGRKRIYKSSKITKRQLTNMLEWDLDLGFGVSGEWKKNLLTFSASQSPTFIHYVFFFSPVRVVYSIIVSS